MGLDILSKSANLAPMPIPTPLSFPQFNLGTWAGLTAAGALIATCWRSILGVLQRISDLFICRIVVKNDAAKAVLSKIWTEGKRSPLRMRIFGGEKSYVFPNKRIEVIGYESMGNEPTLVWFAGIPMIISNRINVGDSAPTTYQTSSDSGLVYCYCLRGTIDPDQFIENAISAYNSLVVRKTSGDGKTRRFNVHRLSGLAMDTEGVRKKSRNSMSDGYNNAGYPESTGDEISTKVRNKEIRLLTWTPDELIERSSDSPPFDLYPFSPNQLSIISEIDVWLKSGDWFREKGVPYRRGFLMHGPAGTGKSTFVRSIGIKFDLPVYVFDLSSYSNSDFVKDWKMVQQNGPAIALLEDIDCIFSGRTNLLAESKMGMPTLTFDCLLNTISGVGASDGVLLFVTTNNIESLDPALGVPIDGDDKSTRPGRLDRMIYFGPMEEPQRRKLASLILKDFPQLVDETILAGEGETAAQFQERCAQLALKEFWKTKLISS